MHRRRPPEITVTTEDKNSHIEHDSQSGGADPPVARMTGCDVAAPAAPTDRSLTSSIRAT
jgi:hypothetical protein